MASQKLAPTAILQQAISEFEQQGARLPEFVAAPKFQGARQGYYFGRGSSGVGYYLDSKQRGAGAAAAEDEDGGAAAAAAAAAARARAAAQPVDAEELLREAEEAAGDAGMEMLDLKGLKRLTLALERKYNANLEARMRYADQPGRFLESEADLDEAVKSLLVVATAPDLYPDLVASTGAIPTLLALLNHENSDIAADAIEVLGELIDADAVEDNEEEALLLVDCLLENDALPLLVHRLGAFDERVPAEASAVYNALGIVESMVEVKPEVAEMVVEKTKLLKWLLGRLRPGEADSNKQYASEILAILVQQSDANKRKMGASNGIDAVLQALAPYRKKDPSTTEEEELVENLFDVVASCLLADENRSVFVEAEGVELLLLILQSKRGTRTSALKCLDFATTRCPPACDRVVDQKGLKTLFAVFMGKLKVKKKKDEASAAAEEEERTVSIIASLLNNCSKQSRRDRVAAKFVEAEFEKCDRLMEVYLRYEARVKAEEQRLAEGEEELEEEELLLARMDAGLYTLQQCALVVGALWLVGDVGVRKRILRLLHQKGRTLGSLRSVLLEYRANLGGDGGPEERARQVERATQMLLALGHDPAEDEAVAKAEAEAKAAAAAEAAEAGGAAAANGGAAAAAGGEADMEMDEEEGAGGKGAAAAAGGGGGGDEDMELEEGEQKEERRPAAPAADEEQQEKEEREGRGGKERERRRSRSRSRSRERGEQRKERRRSRSRDRKERRRDRSRSRSPAGKERQRRERRSRSRSRSRERSRRDRR